MKITDIRTFVVHANVDNWVCAKIYTDEGITGVGEGTVEGKESAMVAAIGEIKRYLIGEDPFPIAHHWHRIFRNSYYGASPLITAALSAVDGALWDIKGKALGVPVYELLGGKLRDKAKVYANRWFFGAKTPNDLTCRATETVEAGFRALKWDPFETMEGSIFREDLRRVMKSVRSVRSAVGEEIDLIIEGHGRFHVGAAIEVANAIAEVSPLFFEEPLMPENLEALADVRAKSPVPIAVGERLFSKHTFYELLSRHAADIIQPDLRNAGGVTEVKKIAAVAEACHIPVAPHNIHGPIGTAMALHVAATIPNFLILEWSVEEIPFKKELLGVELEAKDGCVSIPDRPGLGVGFDESVAEAHPFRPLNLVDLLFDEIRPEVAN